jgi:hypothetical protein
MITFVSDHKHGQNLDTPDMSPYYNVVRSLSDPIVEALDSLGIVSEIRTTPRVDPVGINVRYFTWAKGLHSFFLSHGIADKLWREGGRLRAFDWIGHSGPLWAEKYRKQGVREERLFEVGYTKLDPVFRGDYERSAGVSKRVLFAPTHAPHSRTYPTSYPALLPTIERLRESFDIVIAPHPQNREDHSTTMQDLVDADVVISDCGSLVYEAWALGKPVVFPDWLVRNNIDRRWPGSFEQVIYNRQIGYHAQDEAGMREAITLALEYGITPSEEDFIQTVLPVELRGHSAQRTAEVLSGILQVQRRRFRTFVAEREKEAMARNAEPIVMRAITTFDAHGIRYRRGNRVEAATKTEAAEMERRKLAVPVEDGDDGEDLAQETVQAPAKSGPDIQTNPVGPDSTTHIELPNRRRNITGGEAGPDGGDVSTEEVVESSRRSNARSRDLSEENAHKEELDAQRETTGNDGSDSTTERRS